MISFEEKLQIELTKTQTRARIYEKNYKRVVKLLKHARKEFIFIEKAGSITSPIATEALNYIGRL